MQPITIMSRRSKGVGGTVVGGGVGAVVIAVVVGWVGATLESKSIHNN